MSKSMRWQRRPLLTAACLAGLCMFLFLGLENGRNPLQPQQFSAGRTTPEPPCHGLAGANDTVVILRTGSTELKDRLPIHFSTTLQCYPNRLIFSDYEEVFHDELIIDALDSVSAEILENHADFELHRRLRRLGRNALESSELSGADSENIQWHGKVENPGWKLDKWKFLPMVNRTIHEYPDKKWYVFVEADSFIFWRSTLQYLSQLDYTKPHYSGSQMYIGDVLFAHGGSGFFVSQPAMRMVADFYAAHQNEIESFTDGHWAGDCVLGKAFKDAGVPFTNLWPIIQGDYPGTVAYAKPDGRPIADPNARVWCYPSISYHHLSPDIIEELWQFEQRWFASDAVTDSTILRHKDVFHSYILPRMATPRSDWDSESDVDRGVMDSLDDCKTKCEKDLECRQYSFDSERRCKTRADPRLGKAAPGISSGWLPDRMIQFEEQMAPCGDEGWLF